MEKYYCSKCMMILEGPIKCFRCGNEEIILIEINNQKHDKSEKK